MGEFSFGSMGQLSFGSPAEVSFGNGACITVNNVGSDGTGIEFVGGTGNFSDACVTFNSMMGSVNMSISGEQDNSLSSIGLCMSDGASVTTTNTDFTVDKMDGATLFWMGDSSSVSVSKENTLIMTDSSFDANGMSNSKLFSLGSNSFLDISNNEIKMATSDDAGGSAILYGNNGSRMNANNNNVTASLYGRGGAINISGGSTLQDNGSTYDLEYAGVRDQSTDGSAISANGAETVASFDNTAFGINFSFNDPMSVPYVAFKADNGATINADEESTFSMGVSGAFGIAGSIGLTAFSADNESTVNIVGPTSLTNMGGIATFAGGANGNFAGIEATYSDINDFFVSPAISVTDVGTKLDIESLTATNHRNSEFIIVSNGASADVYDLALSYAADAQSLAPVAYLHTVNNGLLTFGSTSVSDMPSNISFAYSSGGVITVGGTTVNRIGEPTDRPEITVIGSDGRLCVNGPLVANLNGRQDSMTYAYGLTLDDAESVNPYDYPDIFKLGPNGNFGILYSIEPTPIKPIPIIPVDPP